MALHTTTGRWRLGLALALVPAVLWGALPIPLKMVLPQMDGWTIAWYRLLGAGLVLLAALAWRRGLPAVRALSRRDRWLVVVAIVGLAGNYVAWVVGLTHVTPSTGSLFVQASPLFLTLAALAIFRERVSREQVLGLVVLVAGMLIYSREQLAGLLGDPRPYLLGVALFLTASCSWTFYALAQKQLLVALPSPAIMLLVYLGGALLLAPGAHPAAILRLNALQQGCLLFCIFNTVFAYGALAEALNHWEASRVGAVLPLSPLFTLLLVRVGHAWWPDLVPAEAIGWSGYLGALLVVGGSMVVALASRGREPVNVEP